METMYHRYQNVNYLAIIFPHRQNIDQIGKNQQINTNDEVYLLLLFSQRTKKTPAEKQRMTTK